MRDHNQTEFLIEYMQPNLLVDQCSMRRYRWLFRLIFGLTIGSMFGLVFGLATGAIFGLTGGLTSGIFCDFDEILPTESIDLSPQKIQLAFRYALMSVLVVGLIVGLGVGLTAALVSVLTYGLATGLIYGLTYGLATGLIYGLTYGLFPGLVAGLRGSQVRRRTLPNEGMIQGIRSTLILVAISWPGYLALWLSVHWAGLALNLFNLSVDQSNWTLAADLIFFTTAFAAIAGLTAGGGYTLIQHACLRWLLERQQVIPHNYGEFLIFVSDDLQLLKRFGGQFRFYHDLLRERIAS
jgi:hypothetical protein